MVHSLVEFIDGSIVALGPPDEAADSVRGKEYPNRQSGIAERLDWQAPGDSILSRLIPNVFRPGIGPFVCLQGGTTGAF
jgi:1-deoxy-D-xylulose 5-phosphate reductoisomerase